jgi:hypothetical protein
VATPVMVVQVAVRQAGATLRLVAHLGVVLLLEDALLVGEAVVVGHPAGAETVAAQLTEEMEVELLMVEMDHGRHMVAEPRMEEQLPTVEQQHMAATMGTALHMEASTRELAHLVGVDRALRHQNLVACLLQPLVHTTHQRQARMPPRLLVGTEHTLRPRLVGLLWMHPRPVITRLQRLETDTELHQQRHRHQAAGTLQRQHRVVRIRDMIRLGQVY